MFLNLYIIVKLIKEAPIPIKQKCTGVVFLVLRLSTVLSEVINQQIKKHWRIYKSNVFILLILKENLNEKLTVQWKCHKPFQIYTNLRKELFEKTYKISHLIPHKRYHSIFFSFYLINLTMSRI